MPSRAAVPYTSIYAEFTYNYQDTFDTTSNWFNKAYNQVAYGYSKIDCCSVVYYPLTGEDSDYIGMAKRYLHYGRTLSKEQIFERLDAITPEDLLQTAQAVFSPERLLTLEYL